MTNKSFKYVHTNIFQDRNMLLYDSCFLYIKVCDYQGRKIRVGQNVDAGDNCNTCTCQSNGQVTCTQKQCSHCKLIMINNVHKPYRCYWVMWNHICLCGINVWAFCLLPLPTDLHPHERTTM